VELRENLSPYLVLSNQISKERMADHFYFSAAEGEYPYTVQAEQKKESTGGGE
jgi:hypothetical protein